MVATSAKTLMMAATHTPSMSSPRMRRRFMARSPRLASFILLVLNDKLIRGSTGQSGPESSLSPRTLDQRGLLQVITHKPKAKIAKMTAKSAKTLMMVATHTSSISSPNMRRRFMARSPRLAYLRTYGTWADWNVDWG